MDSVDSRHRKCWLCGRNGMQDPLEHHHIFGSSNRKKSDRYGLVVMLCANRCHRNGRSAVHRSQDTMQRLHEYGQRKVMNEQGCSIDQFRQQFGKNYIDEEDI